MQVCSSCCTHLHWKDSFPFGERTYRGDTSWRILHKNMYKFLEFASCFLVQVFSCTSFLHQIECSCSLYSTQETYIYEIYTWPKLWSAVFFAEVISVVFSDIFVMKVSCARKLYKLCINNKAVIQKSALVVKVVVEVVMATEAEVVKQKIKEKQNTGSQQFWYQGPLLHRNCCFFLNYGRNYRHYLLIVTTNKALARLSCLSGLNK